MRMLFILAAALAIMPLDAPRAQGGCSPLMIYELRARGFPEYEIQRICSVPIAQPRPATVCATPAGYCQMMQAVPIGAGCQCFTQWGPVYGQAR